jgi:quinol monooxygenase YgiN
MATKGIMPMFILDIAIEPLPEKSRELEQVLRSMMPRVRQRAGCIKICWLLDMERGTIRLFSVWRDRANLQGYLKSDEFSALLGTRILLKVPHAVEIYRVNRHEGADFVAEARSSRHVPII